MTERAASLLKVPRARRMQRTAIAAATSLMGLAMFFLGHLAGFYEWRIFFNAAIATLILIALFIPLFYTGLNLRFKDPSLFLPQTMSAIVVTSYVMAYAGAARPALALLYFAALVLSALRFSRRAFVVLAAFVLVCHALALYAAAQIEGARFNARADALQWFLMLVIMPWLGWVAGYLERMRQRFLAGGALYRAIWDTSIDAVIVFGPGGMIHLANPAAARLFGYDAANMRGMHITSLTPKHLRESLAGQLAGYAVRGSGAPDLAANWRRFDAMALTAAGREVPVEAALSELDSESQGMGSARSARRLVLFARDVSQRHALEAVKDDFIATVSHELRTPLTAVMGAVEALQHDAAAQLPPAAQSLLNMAAGGAERLKRLVDTILNLQKMDTGGITFVPEPVAAVVLVKGAIDAERPAAAAQGKYLASIRLAEGIHVKADARWIHEVLVNLIDNALHYSPAGATVVIGAEASGRNVRFSVIDQGSGVPDEFAERIFSRFARADTANTRAGGGAGLGLSVCKAAVEGCGGAIGFQNNSIKGATFWFDLPLARGGAQE